MMYADHELLQRKHVNTETMISLDPVADIPRSNFWTSEDGYARKMDELAGAIKSGEGVMRNPLSRQMLTRADIQSIIQYPLSWKRTPGSASAAKKTQTWCVATDH